MEYLLSRLKILTIDKSKADSFFLWCLFIYLLGLHPLLPLFTALRFFYSPVVGFFKYCDERCVYVHVLFSEILGSIMLSFFVWSSLLSVPLKPLLTIFTVLAPYDIDHSHNFYYIQPWKKLYEVSRRNCKMYF